MTMESIWFALWGLLWAVYFVLDGFDFGVGALMPFICKKDEEKRVAYNAIGPFWDGNEVWLISAGGVTFAAFPIAYAVMFSSMYAALLFVLFALILRGVAIEFRSKIDTAGWKRVWDACFFAGSALPAVLFGVAFANLFQGLPIAADPIDPQFQYNGGLLTLINPYGLIGGVFFLFMFLYHGATWMTVKSEGDVQNRAAAAAGGLWWPMMAMAVVFLVASWYMTDLYDNYHKAPALFALPLIAVAGFVVSKLSVGKAAWVRSWAGSAVGVAFCVFFGVAGLYPRIIPSNINPEFNVTAMNAASSPMTLKIMLIVALIFVPLVIIYQAWTYNLFRGKADSSDHGVY